MLILSDLKTAIAGFAGEILRSGHFRWRAPSSTSCAVLLPTQLLPIKHRKSSALSSSSSLFLITIYKYTFVRYPLFQASSPQRAEHIPSTFVHKRTYNTSESYSFANTTTHTHTHTHILHHSNLISDSLPPPPESNGYRARRQATNRHLGGQPPARHRAAQRHHIHLRNAIRKPSIRSTAIHDRATRPLIGRRSAETGHYQRSRGKQTPRQDIAKHEG
jgi:hypothetical protein